MKQNTTIWKVPVELIEMKIMVLNNQPLENYEPILSIDIPREKPGNETDKAKSMMEVITTIRSKVLNAERKNNKNPRP